MTILNTPSTPGTPDILRAAYEHIGNPTWLRQFQIDTHPADGSVDLKMWIEPPVGDREPGEVQIAGIRLQRWFAERLPQGVAVSVTSTWEGKPEPPKPRFVHLFSLSIDGHVTFDDEIER